MRPCMERRGEIQDLLDRRLGAAKRHEVIRHLLYCKGCAGYRRSLQWLRSELSRTPADVAPPWILASVRRRLQQLPHPSGGVVLGSWLRGVTLAAAAGVIVLVTGVGAKRYDPAADPSRAPVRDGDPGPAQIE